MDKTDWTKNGSNSSWKNEFGVVLHNGITRFPSLILLQSAHAFASIISFNKAEGHEWYL